MSASLTFAVWTAFRALKEAGRAGDLPPPHRLVLLALADRADETGKAWPSVETIAGDTGQGVTTVETCLAELEAATWIAGERRSIGKRPLSTRYEVRTEGGAVSRLRPGSHAPQGDTPPGTVSSKVTPRRARHQQHPAGHGVEQGDTPPGTVFDTPPGGTDTPPTPDATPRPAGMIRSGDPIKDPSSDPDARRAGEPSRRSPDTSPPDRHVELNAGERSPEAVELLAELRRHAVIVAAAEAAPKGAAATLEALAAVLEGRRMATLKPVPWIAAAIDEAARELATVGAGEGAPMWRDAASTIGRYTDRARAPRADASPTPPGEALQPYVARPAQRPRGIFEEAS